MMQTCCYEKEEMRRDEKHTEKNDADMLLRVR